MPAIGLLSVVPEKEAHDCEEAIEGAKRYLPIKVFTAHRAVNGVGAAQVSFSSAHCDPPCFNVLRCMLHVACACILRANLQYVTVQIMQR